MARVLIIGATSAIAGEVARLCAARGDRLYLLARRANAMAALAEELGESVVGFETGDLNEFGQNPARLERGWSALGGVDIALVAHGSLGDQLLSESDFGEAEKLLDTNFRSVVSLLIPLANAMEAQQSGHIAVMSSVAAERGRPRNYTYAAGKAGVNTYLQGLRSRLHSSGVRVHILKLGPTDTPMTRLHEKNLLFASADRIARGLLRAIEQGRSEVYLPGYWRPIMFVVRNLPEVVFQKISLLSGR